MLDLANYKLTFDDEFNKLSLDSGQGGTWQPVSPYAVNGNTDSTLSSWTMSPFWGPTSAADANVYSVSNGVASIGFKPTPADVALSDVGGRSFLAGQLTTATSFAQTYGYFEANMKVPAAAGLNSAFWLMPTDGSWPPELDVAEILGNDPTTLVMTSHDGANGQDHATPLWTDIANASQGFHRYGVDWEPDKITWYFDGNAVKQIDTPASMNKPMYMLLDTIAGQPGTWAGAPTPGETAALQVDYVRAYSSNPNAPAGAAPASGSTAAITPAAVLTNGTASFQTGAGAITALRIGMSEDAWNGDAQYRLTVDGNAVGAVGSIKASHALGQVQSVDVQATLQPGQHDLGITFLNDAYGGPGADRNLYVQSVKVAGTPVFGAVASLYGDGTTHIQFSV